MKLTKKLCTSTCDYHTSADRRTLRHGAFSWKFSSPRESSSSGCTTILCIIFLGHGHGPSQEGTTLARKKLIDCLEFSNSIGTTLTLLNALPGCAVSFPEYRKLCWCIRVSHNACKFFWHLVFYRWEYLFTLEKCSSFVHDTERRERKGCADSKPFVHVWTRERIFLRAGLSFVFFQNMWNPDCSSFWLPRVKEGNEDCWKKAVGVQTGR